MAGTTCCRFAWVTAVGAGAECCSFVWPDIGLAGFGWVFAGGAIIAGCVQGIHLVVSAWNNETAEAWIVVAELRLLGSGDSRALRSCREE